MARGLDIGSVADDGVWSLEALENKVVRPTQWGLVASGAYKALAATHDKLPSGAYTITFDNNDDKPIFISHDIKTDELIRFTDSVADKIMKEISSFWESGDRFKKLGFLHRRGYLLFGPQGTGKSSIVRQVVEDVVNRGGVVLICEKPKFFSAGLSTLRKAEPNRNVVCIFEDIDSIIKRYGDEELLSILDGSNMVDRVLNIGTTNYPELLDKRIISRPRRFDRVIKIDAPSAAMRESFLRDKLPKGQNLKKWLEGTSSLSFAGITEAIISVICLNNSLEDTVKLLTDIENGHPSSSEFGTKGSLGFSSTKTDDDDD